MCRAADLREQTDERGGRKQPRESVDRSQRQRAERARNKAEQNQLPPPKPIGQTAADDGSDDSRNRQQSEEDAGFRHPHAELAGDVERKEWEDESAADFIDE